MTGRPDDARSRAPWTEALRAHLAGAFAVACLLFPLAAAFPAAAQEGGKDGEDLVFVRDVAGAVEGSLDGGHAGARARALKWISVTRDIDADLDGEGNTAMHYAAPLAVDILEAVVARGGSCDARNAHGATPLHFAAAQKAPFFDRPGPRSVLVLVECGAPVNARDGRGATPLHALYASVRATRFFPTIWLHDEVFFDANIDILQGGKRLGVLEALLDAGADPNLKDENGETPLLLAIRADPLYVGEPLANHLRLLLRHGADPNVKYAKGGEKKGRTPLIQVVTNKYAGESEKGIVDAIGALIEGGADPDAVWRGGKGKGRTPLIQVVLVHGSDKAGSADDAVELVEALLEGGADPDKRDRAGDTPLIHAAKHEDDLAKVIRALLAGGADPCLTDRRGKLPFEHAAEDSVAHGVLRDAGGNRKGSIIITNFDGSTYDPLADDKGCDPHALAAEAREKALGLDEAARKRVQACLAAQGFGAGKADGRFGPATRAAIRAWQEKRGRSGAEAAGYLAKDDMAELLACESGPRPQCAGEAGERACWMEAGNRPGCYVWNPSPAADETVSWDGACEGGKASGKGRMTRRFRHAGAWKESRDEGEYRDGRRVGHWVESGGDGQEVWEGPFVNGRRHGLWVERLGFWSGEKPPKRARACMRNGARVDEGRCVAAVPDRAMRVARPADVGIGPGPRYRRPDTLAVGDEVTVTGEAGDWLRVEAEGGVRGFVRAALLEEAGSQWAAGETFRECPSCPEMVVVPAGSFMMGSPSHEEGRYGNEGPAHRVTISEPFAAGVYEVTFAEWDACASGGGCGGHRPDDEGWGRGNRPVINVSWKDAQAYADWLSRKTGAEYRLLSEAEWEYAARAGTTTRFHWGDDVGRNRANCYCGDSWDTTAPVGSFAANGWGLHDMHGNVWEWVEDCWNESYAGAPSDGNAWESGNCDRRVLRGGSWYSDDVERFLRSANRSRSETGFRRKYDGFRVARTLAP